MPHWTMHGFARSHRRASRIFACWHEMVSSDTHMWSSKASSQTQFTASMMDLNFCILYPCNVKLTVANHSTMRAASLDPTQLSSSSHPAMAQENSASVWIALSKSNLSSIKDSQNCFCTYSLMNRALALSWALSHVRLVLHGKGPSLPATLPHFKEQFCTLVLQ